MALAAPTHSSLPLSDQLLQQIQSTILQLLDKKKTNNNGQGFPPPGHGNYQEWHYSAPKDTKDTVSHSNKTFTWCLKCNSGRGQWVLAHTTDTHIDGFIAERKSQSKMLSRQPPQGSHHQGSSKGPRNAPQNASSQIPAGRTHLGALQQQHSQPTHTETDAALPPPQLSLQHGLDNCFNPTDKYND